MNIWLENIVRYTVLFLLQVLLVNNLQIMGICNPCIYVLCLLALPITLPRWVELLIGFLTGLLMDIFCNSLGAHTFACTLTAYIRPLLLRNMVQDNERMTGSPCGESIGRDTYIRYIIVMVLIHHTALFSLLAFSWHNWWLTLLQIVFSWVVTTGFILGVDVLKD